MTGVIGMLVSPRSLFSVCIAQALFPYLLWSMNGQNPRYAHVALTYIPLWLWLTAGSAFFVGAALAPRPRENNHLLVLLPRQQLLLWAYGAVLFLIAIQTYLTMNVYGGLPLLSYMLGDGNIMVGTANALQETSGYGQFGLLQISLFTAHALLLMILVYANATRQLVPFPVILSLPLLLLAHIGNAKRQGVVMLLVYIVVGSALITGKAFQFLATLTRTRGQRWTRLLVFLCLGPILTAFTGLLATIRTQGTFQTTGLEQFVSYLEYPLLNLETQAQRAGLGPSHFELLGPMVTLIPYKSRPLDWEMPPKAERSAPASILEHVHWFWGVWGIAAFMLALGFAVQFVYERSRMNVFCLLSYCQLAHALFVAHSSNLFLNLVFVPIPLLVFGVMSQVLDGHPKSGVTRLALLRGASKHLTSLAPDWRLDERGAPTE